MSELLRAWFGLERAALPYLGALAALLALVVVLWLWRGRRPRRRRAYRRAQRLLQQGAWQPALEEVRTAQGLGRLSRRWQARLGQLEGECHRTAAEAYLQERRFEDSLDHFQTAARFVSLDTAAVRGRVTEAMLEEIRRLFAFTNGDDTAAPQRVIQRLLAIDNRCPEAFFWQGLCHVREGRYDEAVTALRTAQEGAGKQVLDPPLYLGALLARQGRSQEALRYLSEANRLHAGCPFVSWQLGQALLHAGGDSSLSVRALQRALSADGLPRWLKTPQRAWLDGLPDPTRGAVGSFVRRLAEQYPYRCPVLGGDVTAMVRQGRLALAQAQYRLGNFHEAADLYNRLLQDGAPSVPVLRGLGLSLARLGRCDEAFKHLRTAHEQEDPKDPLTAGYLALCGARGKPSRPEDKPNNVAWAIRLLSRFHLPGDAEWAQLCCTIFLEARLLGLPVAIEDQKRLVEVLVSVDACDAPAAGAFAQLVESAPEAVRPEHAWLYCRAAQQHGVSEPHDLELFALAFLEPAAARAFFDKRGWDLGEMEFTFLQRWAAQRPGRFPEVLGPDYPAGGERLLLDRSRRLEEAGNPSDALVSATVLLQLAPHSPAAHDRLAYLYYRLGNLTKALHYLGAWHRLHPADPVPLLRRAIIEEQFGNRAGCQEAIQQALERTSGAARAEAAFLGARLALADGARDEALPLVQECLREQPQHADALWCLAALRSLAGDQQGVAALSPSMERPEVTDGRFHYLAGVCHLAAGKPARAAAAAQRAAADPALEVEGQYLLGLAHLRQDELPDASLALRQTARAAGSPSANHARALLAQLGLRDGAYDEAINWWNALDAPQRSAWKCDEALRGTVFLSAVLDYQAGKYEPAADKFREAGRLGCRDRRLAPMLGLSLFEAGRQELYTDTGNNGILLLEDGLLLEGPPHAVAAAKLLEQAGKVGCKDPQLSYLLALAYKRQGNPREARAAFRKIANPDANVWLQLGLLSLREKQLSQAEQEFDRAWQMDPSCFAAGHNLLMTRLSLGRMEACAALLPRVIELAADPGEQRLFTLLQALLHCFDPSGEERRFDDVMARMSADQEQDLLQLVRNLGHLDTVCSLLKALLAARRPVYEKNRETSMDQAGFLAGSLSGPVRESYLEAILVKGKTLLDRCEWSAAEQLLVDFTRLRTESRATQIAFHNLLGCCACLGQDFKQGLHWFTAALKMSPNDVRIIQNVALAHEWQGSLEQADPHWNRYLELLTPRQPTPLNQPEYLERLEHDALCRLAGCYTDRQKWALALPYLERAQRLQPENADTLERLFQLYAQLKRPEGARRTLAQLKRLRPKEPQLELYELDLLEVKDINDVERLITEIGKILQRHPNDPRVEERAVGMVGNVIPLMSRLCDQLTEQLNRVMEQVRGLPNYQINWSAVHDIMRDLKHEFQKLRRITGKCLPLVSHGEHRRIIMELGEHIDRKIEFCKRWEGN